MGRVRKDWKGLGEIWEKLGWIGEDLGLGCNRESLEGLKRLGYDRLRRIGKDKNREYR